MFSKLFSTFSDFFFNLASCQIIDKPVAPKIISDDQKTRQNATILFFEVAGSMFPNTRKNVGGNLESTTMNQLLHQKRIYNPPLKDSIRLL